ncbi:MULTISPECIES: LytR/AlgR family response regulator transcription factor [Niastella]|uniref:LytTR family transcriptional regulator n=1 Tax=Niastella soli TaxID=2821487 RepID=A0ABS3Z4G9_9BACT|nr:LytTR family DNA-binding domain-containing protein [Niastella soli]MBO9205053.1 LytTR family transcriptional regulator [Niastella soli]
MILNRPFPLDIPSRQSLRYTFYAALCVFLILVLLRPFGLDELKSPILLFHAFLYALVTFIFVTANTLLLPRLFPTVYREEKWTVGKECIHMCWHLVPIAIGNWLLTHWLYKNSLSWHNLLNFLWITLVVGVFPLWLNVLLKQQRLLKKYQSGASRLEEQLNQPVSAPSSTEPVPEQVVFISENGKEQFMVLPGEIRYVTSADNYVRIYFIKDNKPASQLLRNTLRKAEDVLSPFPQFFRCHRAFIVNLKVVQHVSGNAQGYKLHLQGVEELIPVSRNLNAQLAENLNRSAMGKKQIPTSRDRLAEGRRQT